MFRRIFISFSILAILLINISLYFSYFLTEKFYIESTQKNIYSQYETIKTFLDINNEDFFSMPIGQVKRMNKLWLYFDIQKDIHPLKTQFIQTNNVIFFQTFYHGYNIVIWKKIDELNYIKQQFLKSSLYINFWAIFLVLLVSYLVSKWIYKPIDEILDFLKNYKLWENKQIKNNYSWTDIWKIINNINRFIQTINKAYHSQKQFIQDISHEIKTPLMQITSSIELIEDKISDIKVKEKLELVKEKTNQISKLVSNLLFIEKLDENLQKEKINLNNFIEKLVKDYKILAEEKDIKIKINNFSKIEIDTNRFYLERLFGNLLSNAIKYNKQDGQIIINIYKDKLEIIDTGIWIKEKDLDKIFDRFYKWENSNGTGLGMAIVKKIIDILWWKINIGSKDWVKIEIFLQ